MNVAMTTFFPSMLLMVISYATTFFNQTHFEAALTVNLTVMLVMTTLFISFMASLAPTSYIKWIEYWLIFAQLIPFTYVILLTIQEKYRNAESEDDPKEFAKKQDEIKSKICWEKESKTKVLITIQKVCQY